MRLPRTKTCERAGRSRDEKNVGAHERVDVGVDSPAVANAFVEDFDVGDALRVGNDRGGEGDVADLGGGRFAGAEAAWARTHTSREYRRLHPEDGARAWRVGATSR